MNIVLNKTRFLLAFILIIFGLNKFLGFMPMPDPPVEGGAFLGSLMNAGYVFPFVGVVFLVSGALLAFNKAVGFALILLAPMTVNILLYHFRFDPAPQAFAPGIIIAILQIIVAWQYKEKFQKLFS